MIKLPGPWFEHPEEKVPQPPDHPHGNEIRMRPLAQRVNLSSSERLCGWPAGRVKFFSVLYIEKITTGRMPQKNALWLLIVSKSGYLSTLIYIFNNSCDSLPAANAGSYDPIFFIQPFHIMGYLNG